MVTQSARYKVHAIRQDFIDGPVNSLELATKLGLCASTINKYRKEFREIKKHYPDKLSDFKFRLPKKKYIRPVDERYDELIALLPGLMECAVTPQVQLIPLWQAYRETRPGGYSLQQFTIHYLAWQRKTGACVYVHRRIREITPNDLAVLQHWKRANELDKWKRATVLLGSLNKRNVHEMATQVERNVQTVQRWIDHYKRQGLDGLITRPAGVNDNIRARIKTTRDNLVKILHESPALHGLNRSSWRLIDLAAVYDKVCGQSIGAMTVSTHLKSMGFGFRKSREILTSPDPRFREKLDHIKNILSNLGPNEKFFSVDEYGHFSVKIKGGRTFTKEVVAVPQVQKSKGWLIVTAALELSTNQVTHFYSRHKNTEEMIKLIEVLLLQYATQDKLYFSWDAASWHASKKLNTRIAEINGDPGTPDVELAPLPASAQFLNVIESVFSGLAKAVIHNSDYESTEACAQAIDRHFAERNKHFLEHPQKAGKLIWGRERVKPVFDEVNNCRYNNMR
ncbi:MAG TPA: IS630 family transposase [Mucilaginibacter sp.]